MLDLTDLLSTWPDPTQARIGVTDTSGVVAGGGDLAAVGPLASISKVIASLAGLVAIEEGTIAVDQAAGPDGCTVRHLLAHASGLAFGDDQQLAGVGERRIYSNTGIEVFADHLAAQAGMPFADYQREAVLVPLGMADTELVGSPAHGVRSNIDDLLRLGRELLTPTLIDPATLAQATEPQFPHLAGVLPGFGRHDPNPWGLGMELRGAKSPHWTAPTAGPGTFGHFGGSGTYLWVDPTRGLAAAAISGTDFGPWAVEAWPATNQQILDRLAS